MFDIVENLRSEIRRRRDDHEDINKWFDTFGYKPRKASIVDVKKMFREMLQKIDQLNNVSVIMEGPTRSNKAPPFQLQSKIRLINVMFSATIRDKYIEDGKSLTRAQLDKGQTGTETTLWAMVEDEFESADKYNELQVGHAAFPATLNGMLVHPYPREKLYEAWSDLVSDYNKCEKRFRQSGNGYKDFRDYDPAIGPFDGGKDEFLYMQICLQKIGDGILTNFIRNTVPQGSDFDTMKKDVFTSPPISSRGPDDKRTKSKQGKVNDNNTADSIDRLISSVDKIASLSPLTTQPVKGALLKEMEQVQALLSTYESSTQAYRKQRLELKQTITATDDDFEKDLMTQDLINIESSIIDMRGRIEALKKKSGKLFEEYNAS